MVDVRPSVVMSPLTPDRVTGAEFGNSFRGFDPNQVRAFLSRVAAELGALQERERDLGSQVAELERQLAEATSIGNQQLDEHRLTELLGVETARVLEAARDAASVLRSNAQEHAAATVAAAEAEAVELRGQAESLLDERARAAEAEAARLLADAEADAARIRGEAEALREQARVDGDAERAAARDEGRRMVAEARAVRERILTDMARRRNQARQQLERLRAGRERLLDAIEAVRRAVDGASGELNDAVVEARLAGERAARQVDVDAVPSMGELDAEVDLARDAGLIDTAAVEREVVGAAGLDETLAVAEADARELTYEAEGPASLDPAPEIEDVDIGDVEVEAPDVAAPDVAPAVPVAGEDDTVELEVVALDDQASEDDAPPTDEPDDTETPLTAGSADEGVESTDAAQRFDVESTQGSVEETEGAGEAPADLVEVGGAPGSTDEGVPVDVEADVEADGDRDEVDRVEPVEAHAGDDEAAVSEDPERRQGFSHAVDDLFSRWKPEDDPAPVVAPSTDARPAKRRATRRSATNRADRDGARAKGRDAAVPHGVPPTEDDGGAVGTAELAASEEGDGVDPPVAEAEAAGAGAGAGAATGTRPATDAQDSRATVARQTRDAVLAGISRDLTRHLKLALSDEQNLVLEGQRDQRSRQPKRAPGALWSELEASDRYEQAARRELTGALEAGWGAVRSGSDERPDPALLDPVVDDLCRLLTGPLRERLRRALDDGGDGAAERVRNLYRETRTEQVGPLAEHGALAAFATGQHAAAGRLPAGPDVRVRWAFEDCVPDCYDNFLAGALPLDATFPTDHRHPPAFPGCRCLLIVDASPARDGAEGAIGEEPPRGH